MAKKKNVTKRQHSALLPTAERVVWLLDQVWDGNRSAMARDISCSPSVITKIAAGSQSPGRRLLTAIGSHPKVNPSWLLSGTGEPLLSDSSEVPAAGWPLPIGRHALAGDPQAHQDLLTGETFPTAGAFYRPSRYWLEIPQNEPILRIKHLRLQPRDLLLIETDSSWWEEMRFVHERMCVVETKNRQVQLAYVIYDAPNPDDPSEHLSVEVPMDLDGVSSEIRLLRKEDNSLEVRERLLESCLPRHRRISLSQIVGLNMMLLRR